MPFDDQDAEYLAQNLNSEQLRLEIDRSRAYLTEQKAIELSPCCLLWSREHNHFKADDIDVVLRTVYFDYESYIEVCRQALNLQRQERKPGPVRPVRGPDAAEVKAGVDIVSVAERYTKLRKAGRKFTGLCPLHEERSPSFFVDPVRQTWHCFGACSRGGDVISLVMAAEGVDFRGALLILEGVPA